MTVAEQILDAAPDITLEHVDFDEPASVDAWRDRMRARAKWAVSEAMMRFRARGLVDATGCIVERDLPADMQPDSKTSVAT